MKKKKTPISAARKKRRLTAGICANPAKPGALALMKELSRWFEAKGITVRQSSANAVHKWIRECDIAVCLGGDGTLLALARQMRDTSVPVLGVNLGSLGFITEVKKDEVFSELENFLAGKSEIEERLMIRCTAVSEAHKVRRDFLALNDVVISREGLTRLVRLRVQVSGEDLTNFSGDGVIVATPTGSTAYSLSAGGAVVHPTLDVMMITPICPHASSLRPIVVSHEEKIRVTIEDPGSGTKALLTADGQDNLEIDATYTVEVTRSRMPLRLIKSSRRGYFETLRENFKFPS
jgi:NAD+ kinase